MFDDPAEGRLAAQEIVARGFVTAYDVWSYAGEEGARSIEPALSGHGVLGVMVRAFQRTMTSDAEYAEGLAQAIRAGAMVLAVGTNEDEAERMAPALAKHGGHSMAYGKHWNFVPLAHAPHTIEVPQATETN
jgi:hypothetical protein